MLVVSEFPQFERIKMRHFPRLFAKKIELLRKWDSVDDHPSRDKRNIKFFDVVSAQKMLWLAEIIVQQVAEIVQDFLFIPKERCHPKMADVAFECKVTRGNTGDLPRTQPKFRRGHKIHPQ